MIRENCKERLAKLAGGVAVLYVGAASDKVKWNEKDRVDDALHATRAAVERGIVAGGGVALVRAIFCTRKTFLELTKMNLLVSKSWKERLKEPLRQIIYKCRWSEGSVIVAKVAEGSGDFGYNAKTDEYVNMLKQEL